MDIKTRMTNISELPPLHQKNAETFRILTPQISINFKLCVFLNQYKYE